VLLIQMQLFLVTLETSMLILTTGHLHRHPNHLPLQAHLRVAHQVVLVMNLKVIRTQVARKTPRVMMQKLVQLLAVHHVAGSILMTT